MNTKRNIIIVLFLLSFSLINAQQFKKIQLSWVENTQITNSHNDEVIKLPLLKEGLFDANYLPYYYKQWQVSNNLKVKNYAIKNIVYSTISKKQYPKNTQKHFPSTLKSSFVVKKARDVSYAQLKLTPLVIVNGVLKRILSFEIDYTFEQSVSLRMTSTVHNSPLASGEWYKFAIDTTGVYKITKSFLNSIGVNTNSINPKNIQLYGNGGARLPELNSVLRPDDLQENSIYIKGENDGSFDADDYILFYGEGPDIWLPSPSLNKAVHQKNIYSDKAYYFIHIGANLGQRIQQKPAITNPVDKTITTYNDYAIHELEKINLDSFGQQFFGENFTINDTQNFSFHFKDIDLTQDLNVTLAVAAVSTHASKFNLNYNNQNVLYINNGITSSIIIGTTNKTNANFTATNEQLNFEVVFDNQGNPSAKAYLDYIEINGSKKLIARDKQFSFRSFDMATSSDTTIGAYVIENNAAIFQIWDVSDKLHPQNIANTSSDTNFTFLDKGNVLHEYVLLHAADYYNPINVGSSAMTNQNLHALKDIDYVIISPENLLDEAQRLANYHKSKGISVVVLTEQIIYNEFSSGAKDPVAIRDFIKHLYTNASTPEKRIKYVLMFGDTSFDFQNIENRNNGVNVIAYQSFDSTSLASSYVTDDFFVMLDDNEGDFISHSGSGDLIDVAIGRMPVKSREEAVIAIDKTLGYYAASAFGKWRNQIALIADDVDNASSDFPLEKKVEEIADLIKLNKPVYNITKIYADAFVQQISSGGEAYPQMNIAIDDAVERGSLIIDYFGHGGENGWGSERFLEVPQIQNWQNEQTLPLFITITCEFSRFDNPTRIAAGEHVFSNRYGGSVNMITTAREVYISFGGNFNINLMSDLLEFDTLEHYTIAQSLAITKNRDSNQKQRFFIHFFGDPAMQLAKPKKNIQITHMNGVSISEELDTIKALSHVYFKGIVTDVTNAIIPDFNGELSVIVYDKSVDKETLNNDNQTYGDNPTIMEFDVRDSKIFTGRVSVENGHWQFDFIAPRDIRIAMGSAKLSFYADNQQIDKNGYNTDITIGGINYDAPEDHIGPQIKLYMNDDSFIDGGNTNENPLLLAELEDESGINTSFTAVDHDIVVILDNDQSNPILLNDYYETELNSFKKGKVKFPLKDLAIGQHTLTFKCWDTYNNPSEKSINFVVVNDDDLVLSHVLNYPNPCINYTEFWFTHNKPNESLDVQVQIFTVSGKLIKTINQRILTSSTLSRDIVWHGLDDFGHKVGKGVYIYKLKVKVISTGLNTEKTEKLVILQ